MGYYLFDHPQAVQQYHPGRAGAGWTGGVLIHTAENVMDTVGLDTGAENVAAFITRRTDYGSYHVLADSDSVIEMLPPTATAFHCAASGYNSTTVGVSYACRSVDLDVNSDWFRNATDLIVGVLVRWWRDHGFDPVAATFVPAPRTREALGLSTHGDAQPADRSDAWTKHPQRRLLEAAFRDAIMRAVGAGPTPQPEGLESMSLIAVDDGTDPSSPPDVWWLTDGQTKRRLMGGEAGWAQAKQLVEAGLASNKRTAEGNVEPVYLPFVLRGAREV